MQREELNFPYVHAVYRRDPSRICAGNQYIEALPSLPTDAELAKALTVTPPFDPKERDLPATQRIELLSRLSLVHLAFPRVVALARAMLWLLFVGYRKRRPFTVADNEQMQALYASQMAGKFVSSGEARLAAQYTMSLIGTSGGGKTFSLRHIMGLLPPAIFHEDLGKWQLPFLMIELPYDGFSAHMLASALFEELDRLLPNANYSKTFAQGKGLNAQNRLAIALSIAREHAVGKVIIDEAQDPAPKDKVPKRPLRPAALDSRDPVERESIVVKQLIRASNVGHIPLLFSGTPEFKQRLGRFSIARRFAGRGSAVWGPLDRTERTLLLKGLFRLQFVKKPIELTREWIDFFGEKTQDLPDIIVKLVEQSQIYAIASGVETLTTELISRVFDQQFETTEFGIQALRTKDPTMLTIASDLNLGTMLPGQIARPKTPKRPGGTPQPKLAPTTGAAPKQIQVPAPTASPSGLHPIDPALLEGVRRSASAQTISPTKLSLPNATKRQPQVRA